MTTDKQLEVRGGDGGVYSDVDVLTMVVIHVTAAMAIIVTMAMAFEPMALVTALPMD